MAPVLRAALRSGRVTTSIAPASSKAVARVLANIDAHGGYGGDLLLASLAQTAAPDLLNEVNCIYDDSLPHGCLRLRKERRRPPQEAWA
jgi:hypothetical protein